MSIASKLQIILKILSLSERVVEFIFNLLSRDEVSVS